jgi:hypothetical protein
MAERQRASSASRVGDRTSHTAPPLDRAEAIIDVKEVAALLGISKVAIDAEPK